MTHPFALSRDIIPDQPTRNELGGACMVAVGIVAVLIIIAAVLLYVAVEYKGGML
jgi:hypothetical protein